MKKTLLVIALIFVQNILFSQSYTVVYEKQVKPDLSGGQLDEIEKKDPALAKQLKKRLESRLIITLFELRHKEGISNFVIIKEENNEKDETLKLESNQSNTNVNVIQVGKNTGSSVLYKDIDNKEYLKSANLMGKDFLVKDTLPEYDWKLSEDTKTIGNYVCKKATTSYHGEEVIAWYTPSIPIHDGPDEYYGLPGLIIELTAGNTTYNALSAQETSDISITKPSKGKEISKAEYQKLKESRFEALKQQLKN